MDLRDVLRQTVEAVPEVIPLLDDAAFLLAVKPVKTSAEYTQVKRDYYNQIIVIVTGYLNSDAPATGYRNDMRRAMVNAFLPAAEAGWTEGGAELPMDGAMLDWLGTQQTAELGYIATLFQALKDLRKSEDFDASMEAARRADGYVATLDRIYNYAKTAAAKNKMLTFAGDDGAESCADCRRYKGKRHKASWWVSHNAVPPNRDFECHGYHCQHILVTDAGEVWTG